MVCGVVSMYFGEAEREKYLLDAAYREVEKNSTICYRTKYTSPSQNKIFSFAYFNKGHRP